MSPAKYLAIAVTLGIVVAAIDQAVKRLVVGSLILGESRPLIPGLVDLSYRQNTGAAFSMFQHAPTIVLVLINLLVLALFVALILPHLRKRGGVIAATLILGGALGNLIDRVRLHYVVDYIDVHVWPVFNIADAAIVIGVAVLFGVFVFADRANGAPTAEGGRP